MFGDKYQPKEYDQFVPEGDYMVKLGMPQDIERNGYHIREIPIQIKGYSGFGPDKWSIFDAPINEPDKMDNWNKQRTRDADVFGVERGDFGPSSWRGKTGMVHIGKDAKGYMKVMYSVAGKPEEHEAPAKPKPEPAKRVDDFNDDIPFN